MILMLNKDLESQAFRQGLIITTLVLPIMALISLSQIPYSDI